MCLREKASAVIEREEAGATKLEREVDMTESKEVMWVLHMHTGSGLNLYSLMLRWCAC